MEGNSLAELQKRRKQIDMKTKRKEGDKRLVQCLKDNPGDGDACLDLMIEQKKLLKKLSDWENGFPDSDRFESISDALSDAVKESTKLRQSLDDWKQESANWRKKIPSWQQTAKVAGFSIILLAGLIPLIMGVKQLDDSDRAQGKYSTGLGTLLVTLGVCGVLYCSSGTS